MFKPVLIGGQDISSVRAQFDQDDKNIIVTSNRQILYYDITSGHQSGAATLSPSKLGENETIVACEKFDAYLYLFTNHGNVFTWNLETRDWLNELSLPIEPDKESLVSCKLISKRQYVFSTKGKETDDIKLNYAMSRSEREKPRHGELIGDMSYGTEVSFDIGFAVTSHALENANKTTKEKLLKQKVIVFVKDSHIYFQRVGIGEKFHLDLLEQTIAERHFTCIRANPTRPMVAAGDTLGRIYLYVGDYDSEQAWSSRIKLHWHSKSVNDLCFSSTGQTLFSCGSESGCVVVWDLSTNNMGQKKVIAGLGMPIRHLNCSENIRQLVLSSEDNEIIFMDTDQHTKSMKTLTRRTYDMYVNNDSRAVRFDPELKEYKEAKSVGLMWHSKTDSLVTNAKIGCLQFYSPSKQAVIDTLDGLKAKVLSLEQDGRVLPGDITKAAFSSDGDWLAFFETRDPEDGLFPDVRLHIFQRSSTQASWHWIQTADRLHETAGIADLKFSPDGQYLVSLGDDGSFKILYKINLDAKSNNKQMYAKGYFGNVSENLPSKVAFSQDSSVLAIGLKNETTLIWMIVDPYKLEYECQLSRDDVENLIDTSENNGTPESRPEAISVIGLHFGHYEPPRSIAPLCEVRSKYIRIWNILKAQSNSNEMMEYLASDAPTHDTDADPNDEFTAAAFDQSIGNEKVLDHFAVATRRNLVHIFELKINEESRRLQPLIVIDASLTHCNLRTTRHYTGMCFVGHPILDIDTKSHQDQLLLNLINRLCLMTNQQELVGITDKLSLERQSASNNCNEIKSYELGELNEYFAKSMSMYRDELKEVAPRALDSQAMTEKQRKIRQKLEVQQTLKDVFYRIPSHNLPRMEILGPMILDKLTIN